eukprot:1807378-Alexandrium_andersonii.AAC.1
MSASLVGSEMCIRDSRRRNPQSRAGLDWILDQNRGREHELFKGICETYGCLLYTSDAADDM